MMQAESMGTRRTLSLILLLAAASLLATAGATRAENLTFPDFEIELQAPDLVLSGIEFSLQMRLSRPQSGVDTLLVLVRDRGAEPRTVTLAAGVWTNVDGLELDRHSTVVVTDQAGSERALHLEVVPGLVSILPPLLAILLAIVFRNVVVSLFFGVWLGATVLQGYSPWSGLFSAVGDFAVSAIADRSHAAMIVFTLLLGGMVGVISKSGGSHGIVDRLSRIATSARRGQLATWLLGIVIFFDDYANTLIVGSTLRPLTDRLKVSREKLAYIVDSTAAPVASIAAISTWIGYEVGLIADGLRSTGIDKNAYLTFLRTIPYRFYPILALVFGLAVALTGRDFGPMLKAERRAWRDGKPVRDGATLLANFDARSLSPDEGIPRRWFNAAVPILIVIVSVAVALWLSGRSALLAAGRSPSSLYETIGAADPFGSLTAASILGSLSAIALVLTQRILPLGKTMEAWIDGMRSMFMAMVILVLAWSIGSVCTRLHTANYIVGVVAESLPPHFLPVITFLVAAVISLATGTSWGTMAIVMPLVIPLAHELSAISGLGAIETDRILLGAISSVLAGAVFGDHCSPISDTTVLSSMASCSDHIDHVRTQLPYAVVVALIGMAVGDIPSAFGLSPWVSLAVGTVLAVTVLFLLGKKRNSIA